MQGPPIECHQHDSDSEYQITNFECIAPPPASRFHMLLLRFLADLRFLAEVAKRRNDHDQTNDNDAGLCNISAITRVGQLAGHYWPVWCLPYQPIMERATGRPGIGCIEEFDTTALGTVAAAARRAVDLKTHIISRSCLILFFI